MTKILKDALDNAASVKLAENYGYSVEYKIEGTYRYANTFIKGKRRIWSLHNGKWQTSDLIKGMYTNHLKFPSLEEAFQRELNNDIPT
jgi:hypothetical protein